MAWMPPASSITPSRSLAQLIGLLGIASGSSLRAGDGTGGDLTGDVALLQVLDENDIVTILSSIELLESEDPDQANRHYEKGLMFYQSGDALQAQTEFANAYYLSPKNPDYTFMLAKSLCLKKQEFLDYTNIKDLLNNVLKIKPDHKEARKLLKEIEPRLPKEIKN